MATRPNYGRWGSEVDDYYQRYKGALNEYSQAQMEGALASNQSAENDLYRYIGIQQQNMEREIKQRRMNALRTGQTSAQLASQELQTMLAAQQGAQQVARDYMQQRQAIEGQFAGYQQGNEVRALEDYAYRMAQADNIQAQYDVAEIQVDPTITARAIAEADGYDWNTMPEKQRREYIDVALSNIPMSDVSSGNVGKVNLSTGESIPGNGAIDPGVGGHQSYYSVASYNRGANTPLGVVSGAGALIQDNLMGFSRAAYDVFGGAGNATSRMMEYSQAKLRGNWTRMYELNPEKAKKDFKKQGISLSQIGISEEDDLYNRAKR